MVGADPASDDVGFQIVFAEDGRASQAAEHGDLADVIQRVGDGALEKAFGGTVERFGRGEAVVELLDGGEEAVNFGVPGKRCRVLPGLLALCDGERPVKKIAQVRENLRGRPRLVPDMKSGKAIGRAAQSFCGSIGDRGERVPQELAPRIGQCGGGRSGYW